MKSFAAPEGSVSVGDGKGSSGIQSMTRVHGKLINTANPLDLFQLTVPARTMWDMQLTKASGWLTPHLPVSLPASLGSESNSTADICALTIWGLRVWCIAGPLSLSPCCNYEDGLLSLGQSTQGLTQTSKWQHGSVNNETGDDQRRVRHFGSICCSTQLQLVTVWTE